MQAFHSSGRYLLTLLIAVLIGLAAAPQMYAQSVEIPPVGPGTWQAYPSMRQTQAILVVGSDIWVGTNGGVYRYDVTNGEIKRFTRVEGLAHSNVTALAEQGGFLWIGYANGVLDRLDLESEDIRAFRDIERADRYPDRRINRIRVIDDWLYIATAFGIVVFDPERSEVRDTYDAFADWERGIATYDFMINYLLDGTFGYWVATENGLATASIDTPNLRVPGAWTVDRDAPSNILVLGYQNGAIYAGRERVTVGGQLVHEGDLYRASTAGQWNRQFLTGWNVYDIIEGEDYLLVVSDFHIGIYFSNGSANVFFVEDSQIIQAAGLMDDGTTWIGSRSLGLGRLPDLNTAPPTVGVEQHVVPEGPLTNELNAIGVGNSGELWVGYQPFAGIIDGVARFDGLGWTHYGRFTDYDVPHISIAEIFVDSRGDMWAGTFGAGIVRVTSDEDVIVYNASNSTLRPDQGTPDLISVFGIHEDSNGRVWVTNRNAVNTLHVWDVDEGWTGLPSPNGIPAGNRMLSEMIIDRFDQKWIIVLNQVAQPSGFAIVQTGDPFDPVDDEAIVVNAAGSPTTGTGLPAVRVTALAADLDGRIWIGTVRGIAMVHSPGSVFGNPALATPTWPRTADQSSYFLRDLAVNVIRVDPAGRLWIGSGDGIWLVNAAGNEVLAHYTSENSPLPAGPIVDLAIDPQTGFVYMATSEGLYSYRTDTIEPSATAERLQVFPNPFRPYHDPFVRVEGLVAETRVRILTVDGQVVAAFDVRGGSVSWDGRDQRTGQLVPSGVYLVAAVGLNGEGTAYGKIAIVH